MKVTTVDHKQEEVKILEEIKEIKEKVTPAAAAIVGAVALGSLISATQIVVPVITGIVFGGFTYWSFNLDNPIEIDPKLARKYNISMESGISANDRRNVARVLGAFAFVAMCLGTHQIAGDYLSNFNFSHLKFI